MKARKLLEQTGVSLLEVLITLAIAGTITTAVFKTYLTQHQNYMTQDAITNVQQNARVVIDEISRQIRMAGNNLPSGIPAIIPSNANPDTITLTYRINNCEVNLTETMASTGSVIKCNTDVSCFHDNQWAYIFEPDSNGGELFQISSVDNSSFYLYHGSMPLSRIYTNNAVVMLIQQLKYFVDNTSDTENPKLMLQVLGQPAQVFAEYIADFQIEYLLRNSMVVDEPLLINDIREVRINVVGSVPDSYASTGTDKKYRVRAYSSAVNVRNL